MGERSLQPVFAAMAAAICLPRAVMATPPISNRLVAPSFKARAASATASGAGLLLAAGGWTAAALPLLGDHAILAGTIKVEILPAPRRASVTAVAPSEPSSSTLRAVRTQWDTGRAKPSMSAVKGAL